MRYREEELEKAIIHHVEHMDVDELRQYVIDDLWAYWEDVTDEHMIDEIIEPNK